MNCAALFAALAAVVTVHLSCGQTVSDDTDRWIQTLLTEPNRLRMRREIRDTSTQDLQNFFRAINILKNDMSLRPNKYDALCSLHTILMNIAHQGPNFLGWHRVYLIMFENALNQVVPGVTIPFWNNTLDNNLRRPSESPMFSASFVGNGHGPVNDGPFRGWNTPHGYLYRDVGNGGRLMTNRDERNIMSRFYLEDVSYPNAPNWTNAEEMHNKVHVWVGGQMRRIESACYDPMFWLHHAYIDCIWQKLRTKQKQNGIDPSNDYPFFTFGKPIHAPNAPLGFGWLLIRHAVHDYFSENFSRCAPTPTCSRFNTNCGTSNLMCDVTRDACIPRPIMQDAWNSRRGNPNWEWNV